MSEILTLALSANIPVVKITSDDPEHLEDLLGEIANRPVKEVTSTTKSPSKWFGSRVYFDWHNYVDPDTVDYDDLLEREITLLVVNATDEGWAHARDCGSVTPPIDYITNRLDDWIPNKQLKEISRYFVGMSLKDVIETILITQARDKHLTPTGINETKSYLGAGMAGLESLDTKMVDYVPPEWAEEWLKVEAPLLDNADYVELWPKGFMLHGPTGTGKTELARFIANQLGWPLYRLDLGSLYSRWQGESEANLRKVLSFISSQGESVFLLDEAEKLFGNDAVGQASLSTLLSMLLWWLQGETNRTITVMTANRLEVIPPELYRPGRLDAVHNMSGLTPGEVSGFVNLIATRLGDKFGLDAKALCKAVLDRYSLKDKSVDYYAQASLVADIRSVAKRMIIEKDG